MSWAGDKAREVAAKCADDERGLSPRIGAPSWASIAVFILAISGVAAIAIRKLGEP